MDYVNAIQRIETHTNIYCGSDCDNPPELPEHRWIQLNDGLKVGLSKNPAALLKNEYLNQWFDICELAKEGQIFPVVGGYTDQPSDFLELYLLYLRWRKFDHKLEKLKGTFNG